MWSFAAQTPWLFNATEGPEQGKILYADASYLNI